MSISYKKLFDLLEQNGWTTYKIRNHLANLERNHICKFTKASELHLVHTGLTSEKMSAIRCQLTANVSSCQQVNITCVAAYNNHERKYLQCQNV